MNKRYSFIILVLAFIACYFTACKDDVASAGQSVLDEEDAIIVLSDTFPLSSMVDSCDAIISQADSFLLGEIETDYGLLKTSILTQLACPEGYSYPANAEIDSVCLFMYYGSWVGDGNSPIAINAYLMDKGTFKYSGTYPTDINIDDYCSKQKTILANHSIVVASEKMDSIQDENGNYIPVLRMRTNDDFMTYFWSMKSFGTQEEFNQQFNGILIETSFGSSTILNVSDIALGVYYKFSYTKGSGDTTVHDMKAFYANSEIRTVNHIAYPDKQVWIEDMQKDSDYYNYIVSPAGAYTRITFPMKRISDSIMTHMTEKIDNEEVQTKQPYVNKASVRIDVLNKYNGSEADKTRNEWLQPASYMLLIKESSMKRFFDNRELPTDTCALLSSLIQGTDSTGDAVYYYTFDMSEFLTSQLRKHTNETNLNMMLVPVSISTTTSGTTSTYSAVRQLQSLSGTQIKSAKSGMKFEIVYSGFAIPKTAQE